MRPITSLFCFLKRYSHVINAAQHPVDLDDRQANAVSARIELDLRIGASFTRLQTLQLQSLGEVLADRIISYGLFRPNQNEDVY